MIVWLLVISFVLPFVYGDIDFMDCGSENMVIDKIDIPGCKHVPCRFYKGHSYPFYITPDLIIPEIHRIQTYASVLMWGAHIQIPAQCDHPCISIQSFWKRPHLNVTVKFPQMLLGRPAKLHLWAISTNGWTEKRFCIALQIDIR